MSHPIRNLPVVQNWSCHVCGNCCRTLVGLITDEEKRRIEALDLANDPEVAPGPWFKPMVRGVYRWRLNHRREGGCVFLTAENRCRLQERFGPEVKPFVCRMFPFMLIPAGNHWRVGMRFSCPSAVASRGRPVADSQKDLVQLSHLLESHLGRSADDAPAPSVRRGRELDWPDACRLVDVLVEIVQDRRDRLERRLRKCLAVARICREGMEVRGGQLSKFLQAVRSAVDPDVARDPASLPPPDRFLGRVLFRVLLAIFARHYRDASRASGLRRALNRVRDGLSFARGRGRVPRLNDYLPEVRFEDIEERHGIPPEADEILERYYAIKLSSFQFFGPPNFEKPIWDGLESLVLTLPMILWLSRAMADQPPMEAVQRAIQLVDDHFGGDAMLGLPHIRYLERTLVERGDLEKVVAWYSR